MEQEDNDPSADAGSRSSDRADDGVPQQQQRDTTPSSSRSFECNNNTGDSSGSVFSPGATEAAGSVAAVEEAAAGQEQGLEGAKEPASAAPPAPAPASGGKPDNSSSPAPAVNDCGSGSSVGGAAQEGREKGEEGLVRVESAPSLKRSSDEAPPESRNEELRKVKCLLALYGTIDQVYTACCSPWDQDTAAA